MYKDPVVEMLERLKQSIYRDLDKAGNFRRVDEDTARRAVSNNIEAEINSIKSRDA